MAAGTRDACAFSHRGVTTKETAMSSVGMIGMGEMGSAMTGRLVERGVRVVGYDPDGARAAQAEDLGAMLADSPADVAHKTDGPLLLNVQTLDQAYSAWRDGDGL